MLAVLGMVAIAGGALVATTGIVGSARSAAEEEAQAQVEREGAELQAALSAVDALVSHGEPSACVRSGFLAPIIPDFGAG